MSASPESVRRESTMITLKLIAGLVALYYGAEWLLRGGATLAVRLGHPRRA